MKGFIYRIYDNTNGNVYYGSTFQRVSQRISDHRSNYKQYLKGKYNHVKSFDILKNDDYDYTTIEVVDCESKYELHNRERFYIESNECINKCIPNRTDKEYREANQDKIREKNKKYYEDNEDKIRESKKNYRKDNKDKIKEKSKEYYEANKEKLIKKKKCECGCIVAKYCIQRHKKSKKHNDLLKNSK